MKFIALTSFFFICLISFSFQEELSQFIVNGENANIQDHPYMVNIASTGFSYCGGAILTQRSVVTAAHCLLGVLSRPFLVTATVGSSYRNGRDGQSYRALRLFSHPDFVYPPYVNDIAIIRTTTRIQLSSFVQPIPLAGYDYIGINVSGIFTGFGVSGYGPILVRLPNQLQKMNTTTISNDECREKYKVTDRYDWVVDQKLCVISTPRTSVCAMDSGGPLVINGELAGILVWRIFPCGDELPDVFVRISAVRQWINSVLL
ncbi:hypothetical protein PVAND_000038 [Polypedilum vanderplanki]|uniref:Peptidase S1 domain-containing protein n=1 Tax=Polypedilum vanderplanki TaxID=319348 RepID=A0A9J6BJ74_POLVA|nr:hypothetical protein PVAND_000038 [Polypedilum vanderplanki]